MFNRYARTAAASSALLLIAGVAVAQVGGKPMEASDPRTAQMLTVDDNPSIDDLGVDISGPCDEVEHANDARCAGVGAAVAGADTLDTTGGSGKGSDHTAGDDRGGDRAGERGRVDDNPSADDLAEGVSGGDDSTSTTVGDTTSTTIDDSTTSTLADDSTSTTVDDHGGDDDDDEDDYDEDDDDDDEDDASDKGRDDN